MTVIVGGGGHGRDVAAVVRAVHGDVASVYVHDDNPEVGEPVQGVQHGYIVGINDPAARAAMVGRVTALGWRPHEALVHPTAYVGPGCRLGKGVVIGPFVSLLCEVRIGDHVHVGAGSHLTRCTVGEFTTLAPGVTVCGDVAIGPGSLLGAGATVRNLVTVGAGVVAGAGAVVVGHVPSGTTVKGVPAR